MTGFFILLKPVERKGRSLPAGQWFATRSNVALTGKRPDAFF